MGPRYQTQACVTSTFSHWAIFLSSGLIKKKTTTHRIFWHLRSPSWYICGNNQCTHLASHVGTTWLFLLCSRLQCTFHNKKDFSFSLVAASPPKSFLNTFCRWWRPGEKWILFIKWDNETPTAALLTGLRCRIGWVLHPAIPMVLREKTFSTEARSSCSPRCSSQGHLQLGASLPCSSVWLDVRVGGGEGSNYTFLTCLWFCDYSRRRLTSLLSHKDTPQRFPLCLLSSRALTVWWGSVIVIYCCDTQPINVLA